MKRLIATALVCIGIGGAIGFQTTSFGLTRHDHSAHAPVAIPDSWTDAEVAVFIADSDQKIDAWAGRVLAPGEVIVHDGLEFKKSTPDMVAQRSCMFCPIRNVCHNTGAPSVGTVPQPPAPPRPAGAGGRGGGGKDGYERCMKTCLKKCEADYKDCIKRHGGTSFAEKQCAKAYGTCKNTTCPQLCKGA
jgi:hypothetical protein